MKLNQIILVALILLIPLALFAQFSKSAKGVGKVQVLQKEVTVVRGSTEKSVSGFGMNLEMGDLVKAGPNGKAKILLSSGDEIIVAAGSELRIDQETVSEQKQSVKRFLLSPIGKIRARIVKRRNKRLVVKTANAVIGVKGTDFVVEFAKDNTTVATVEGLVNMVSSTTNQEIDIPAGKMSTVTATGEVMPLSEIAGDIMSGVEISGKIMKDDEISGERIDCNQGNC